MKKIAFLNIYSGVIERGSEIFVSEIAERLSLYTQVDVYQVGLTEGKKYRVKQIKGIPKTSTFYHLWVGLFTLKCLPDLWKNKYDYVIPVNGRLQTIICRLFRFLRGGKILISGHSGMGFDDRFNLLFGNPDIFVALTPDAYTWAKNFKSKSAIQLIANGVDTEKFKPGMKKTDLKFKCPLVLCVAALEEYKRIDRLILAVENLKDVNLLVIGQGPLKIHLEELGRQKLGNRFRLLEYIPNDKLPEIYNSVQVFSLPSKESEAFGLVYLEALACNLPVVAPDDRNRRELIGEVGFYCNVENKSEYAHTLRKALETSLGNKPRERSLNYSWEKIARKYYQVMVENYDQH